MSDRPIANLVRTIEYGKSTTYIFSCVDCGKEFVRSANNRRINPYCGDCQRKYDKIKNADNKAKRQEEHDKQIRAEVIDEIRDLIRSKTYKVVNVRFDNTYEMHDRALGRLAKNVLIEELLEELEQLKGAEE